eukprot:3927244-Prymnesium_polylepis.1
METKSTRGTTGHRVGTHACQHVHCRQQACGGCFAFDDERGDLVDLFGILSILTPNMANAHEEQVAPVCCRHAVRDAHLYGVDD